MFEYFNCGVDYLLIVDHTKTTMDDVLRQLTEAHASSFFLGTFISNSKKSTALFVDEIERGTCHLDASPTRKPIRLPQQPIVAPPRPRTVQLKNVSFKYPKPFQTATALTNNSLPMVIKDRMKQPIANDKTRCAVLISTNGKILRRRRRRSENFISTIDRLNSRHVVVAPPGLQHFDIGMCF